MSDTEPALRVLGTFAVRTSMTISDGTPAEPETADAWLDDEGNVFCVGAMTELEYRALGSRSGSTVAFAFYDDSGVRYCATPVSRATFRRWVRQAACS